MNSPQHVTPQKKGEMFRMTRSKNLVSMLAVVLLLIIAVPATSFGKDRGRRGRGGDRDNRKCGKFVNCHDARDGRWDGRGPRRDSSRWSRRNNRRDDDWRRDRWRNNTSRDTRWWSRDDRWRDNDWRNQWSDNRWRDRRDRRDRFVRRTQYWDRWR